MLLNVILNSSCFVLSLRSAVVLYTFHWFTGHNASQDWYGIILSPRRLLKTDTTGGCLAYHTESTKQPNMDGNRSISLPDVRSFYCQLSNITSYHFSAMSVVMIRCWRSCFKEQWIIGVAKEDCVNHGRTTSKTGPVNIVIAAHRGWWMSMDSYHSRCMCRITLIDAWASRVLVS